MLADRSAVEAAITEPWSNSIVEGHAHKVKLIKRQGYGRAKPGTLRALLGAADVLDGIQLRLQDLFDELASQEEPADQGCAAEAALLWLRGEGDSCYGKISVVQSPPGR
jgi:hypothetical protein